MKRVLTTRPRAQTDVFAEKLRAAGFEPIFFPVIEICPIEENVALERALTRLNCYDWVVFTSVNAVEVVFEKMRSTTKCTDALRTETPQRISANSVLSVVKTAAIGPKTAAALQARGVMADFVPEEYVAESILPGLGDLRGKWILLPRAKIARKALPIAIARAGGVPHEIAVYQTLPAEPDLDGMAALKSGVDWITFTSPSTVHSFVEIVRKQGLDPLNLPGKPKTACIGPITQGVARDAGFQVALVAREYTTVGLIEAIRHLEVL